MVIKTSEVPEEVNKNYRVAFKIFDGEKKSSLIIPAVYCKDLFKS